jgi:hypothetical protein
MTQEFIEEGMSEEAAQARAKKIVYNESGRATTTLLMYAYILNMIWRLIEPLKWDFFDDEDEKERRIGLTGALAPLHNFLLGQQVEGAITGAIEAHETGDWRSAKRRITPTNIMTGNLDRTATEITRAFQADGNTGLAVAMATSQELLRYSLGVDLNTWMNKARAVDKGLIQGGGGIMAWQYFTNVPQSIRIASAKQIRDGESIADYAHRVSLAYASQARFEREKRDVINKFWFNEDGDMTRFNRAMRDAREWKKLDDKTKKLEETGEKLPERDLKRFEELDRNGDLFNELLKIEQDANKWTREHLEDQKDYPERELERDMRSVRRDYERVLRRLE